MEQLSSQTEKISTYETSRTHLSLVDENRSVSNNDEDFQMDGFYVREKSDKRNDAETAPNTNREDNQLSEANINDTMKKQDNEVTNEIIENSLNNDSKDANGDNKGDSNNFSKELEQRVDIPDNENLVTKEQVHCDDVLEEECGDNKIDNNVANEEDNIIECQNDNNVEKLTETKIEGEINDSKKEMGNVQEGSSLTENPMPDSTQTLANGPTSDESDRTTKDEEQQSDKDQDRSNLETNTKSINYDEKLEEIDGSSVLKDNEPVSVHNNYNKEDLDKLKQENVSDNALVIDKKDTEVIKNIDDDSKLSEKSTSPKETKTNRVIVKRILPKRERTKKTNHNVKKASNKNENMNSECSQLSILKEQLERHDESEEMIQNDIDMDEDFDPSLLCPDISMDIDEAPVITNTEDDLDDGKCSPLPYEAVFSEMVDEITGTEVEFQLTPQELEMKHSIYGPNNPIQYTKIHCTACNLHLGSALAGANNRFVHPLLKVLICKNCYHFYTSGEFEKDEDGSELYCRWCGQGGQVLCCSSCEYVFCKRCIRNNFGQKKFREIRDSDDWNCFRCDAPQLSYLRAACSEFMDYYRNEMARVRTLAEEQPELMTKDYTKCCNNTDPKPEESKIVAQAKLNRRKRKDSSDDPDYKPLAEDEEVPKKVQKISFAPVAVSVGGSNSGFRPLLPKITTSNAGVRQILLQPQSNIKQVQHKQVFRVGNTTFRAKSMATPRFAVRPGLIQGQNSGFIKTLPQRLPAPQTATIIGPSKKVFTAVRMPGKNLAPATTAMKHEWFEKTVRAAARVNSNLSYTLTQLNRQQSQANNVEALAVVHNKLQEVLSSSINSLIQIRKNLRTEFIAGIKNVKFHQYASTSNTPIVVKDDDDVIIVNSTSASSARPTATSSPPPLVFASATSTVKTYAPKTVSEKAGPSSTPSTVPVPKGGFLKVRSFSALQNVTSECITIPDDPPPPKVIEEAFPEKISAATEEPVVIDDHSSENGDGDEKKADVVCADFMYNVTQQPTPEVQKMMNVVVKVKRSRVVDEIIRLRGLINCASSSDNS